MRAGEAAAGWLRQTTRLRLAPAETVLHGIRSRDGCRLLRTSACDTERDSVRESMGERPVLSKKKPRSRVGRAGQGGEQLPGVVKSRSSRRAAGCADQRLS